MGDAPTSQPAGGATDAFRSFLLDIQQGNPADLAKLCTANGEDARTLFHDFQALASAMRYLRTAVTAKFGADAVDAVLPALPTLTDLDDVNEKVTGDRAELSGESVWPIHLMKIQGRWELDLDWLARSEDMPGNPHWFGLMAQAVRRTGDDVGIGQAGDGGGGEHGDAGAGADDSGFGSINSSRRRNRDMAQTKHQIQAILAEADATPRQRFGQNFMIDGNLVRIVAEAGQIEAGDLVIEVGPGTGTLTEELLATGAECAGGGDR